MARSLAKLSWLFLSLNWILVIKILWSVSWLWTFHLISGKCNTLNTCSSVCFHYPKRRREVREATNIKTLKCLSTSLKISFWCRAFHFLPQPVSRLGNFNKCSFGKFSLVGAKKIKATSWHVWETNRNDNSRTSWVCVSENRLEEERFIAINLRSM